MPSIAVLEHFQKPTDKPLKRIKRADGQTQVRRGVAIWIVKNVLLQLLPPHTQAHKEPMQYTSYIPFGLEPSVDSQIGVRLQFPALPNQVRNRRFAEQSL